MAHFAELDGSNKVLRVVVVDNNIETAAGPLGENDGHVDGETWCKDFFGQDTNWKQTSYNNNFRKRYAGKGMIYDAVKDKFLTKQPYPSWSLNADDDWIAPVAEPTTNLTYTYDPSGESTGYEIYWDEDNTRWISKEWSGGTAEDFYVATASKDVYWDPSTSTWKDV